MAGRANAEDPQLKRGVSLLWLALYGLGTTIGAGIYVLVGAAAGYAGPYAPLAFVVAALVIAPTAGSFAELSARFPVSAGEAAYVQHGFGLPSMSLLIGLVVAGTGAVASATLVQGAVGYLATLLTLPTDAAVLGITLLLGAVVAWGITQTVLLAGLLTLVDILGLVLVIAAGLVTLDASELTASLAPKLTGEHLRGILAAALIGFFAFIGFEDIVNVAEETRAPERALPAAIAITLITTTVLYVAVAAVAVAVVPAAELADAPGPLALVFERTGLGNAAVIAAIAVAATLNGILIQMVMASRVVYGLARLGRLPRMLGRVSAVTRTPLAATALVVAVVAVLALTVPLLRLAVITSTATLVVFAAVNAALIRLKSRQPTSPGISVPRFVPWSGLVLCLGFLAAQAGRFAGL